MIVTILKVRLTTAGFAVSYSRQGAAHATILKPDTMPPGHELIRTGETVDLVFDGGTVVSVCACGRSRMLVPHVA